MTKAALHQLTRNLSCEWAEDGIRVNAVAPWYIRTQRSEPVLADPGLSRGSARAHADAAHRRTGGSRRGDRLPVPAGGVVYHRGMHCGRWWLPALRVLAGQSDPAIPAIALIAEYGESALANRASMAPMQTETASQTLDPAICEQARLTRDARFDGLFFTAVKTTGIYCRPVCPAPTPKARNIVYYPSAAAAAAAGFRPCLRCRPEAAPGSPLHHASSALVTGAPASDRTGRARRASGQRPGRDASASANVICAACSTRSSAPARSTSRRPGACCLPSSC